MEDKLITEHAGTRRDAITRFYQYGRGGVRVLDPRKTVRRMYLFDPSSDLMTERDPLRRDTILRRFIFDNYGMLEETFAFGERPRTFRYENGGRQIAIREGGDYGAVGKIITFEENGISETAWGRNGEIERVYQFDLKDDSIIMRKGGYYGEIERTIVFAGMGAALFCDPEAFLQFLMFTEWSDKDRDDAINDRVAEIRGGNKKPSGQSPFAFTAAPAKGKGVPKITGLKKDSRPARGATDDTHIDFIPDADAPAVRDSQKQRILSRQSRDISYQDRRGPDSSGGLSRGRSAEIPPDERFGQSAEIPPGERFADAGRERQKMRSGRRGAVDPRGERGDDSGR